MSSNQSSFFNNISKFIPSIFTNNNNTSNTSPTIDSNTKVDNNKVDHNKVDNTKAFWKPSPSTLPGSIKSHRATRNEDITNGDVHKSLSNSNKQSPNLMLATPNTKKVFNDSISNTPPESQQSSSLNLLSFFNIIKKGNNNSKEKEIVTEEKIIRSNSIEKSIPIISHTVKLQKFELALDSDYIDLSSLQKISWNGIPMQLRPIVWKLLLGYLPPSKHRHKDVLKKRRSEYYDLKNNYYDTLINESENTCNSSSSKPSELHQILVDTPRTCPSISFFLDDKIQQMLQRLLYIFSVRHPACGYVQGINDLATPFIYVYSTEYTNGQEGIIPDNQEDLFKVESDSYWSLSLLLTPLISNYTPETPGIQRTAFYLQELVNRVDLNLAEHLTTEGVEFIHFTFRWINALLLREFPLIVGIRIWDTLLSDDKVSDPHFVTYLSASLLLRYSEKLRKMDFQELISFLQHLPTQDYSTSDVDSLVAEAFLLKELYHNSPNHWREI